MNNWLHKEYFVHRKIWGILLESLINALILTIIVYFCVTKYNDNIVRLLSIISNNNIGLVFAKTMFPIILIIVLMLNLLFYVTQNTKIISSKNKKKNR